MNPILIRWVIYAALAAGLLAAGTWAVHTYNESLREDGRAEKQAEWDGAKLAQQAADLEAARAAAATTLRRIERQGESHDVAAQDRAAALAAAASAGDRAERLQRRADGLIESFCAAAGDPASVTACKTAQEPARVLADVQRRVVERARLLAGVADERGTAGRTCERDYDALTPPS